MCLRRQSLRLRMLLLRSLEVEKVLFSDRGNKFFAIMGQFVYTPSVLSSESLSEGILKSAGEALQLRSNTDSAAVEAGIFTTQKRK